MRLTFLISMILVFSSCTQESQNSISRGLQNYTGINGVLDFMSDNGQVIMRFIKVDKLSTARGTNDSVVRPYRYGYGVLDINKNYKQDENEKKIYFEISEYTTYIFYENPNP